MHGRPGAGRVRGAGGRRHRHLVRRHRLGRAIRHRVSSPPPGDCRHRSASPLGPARRAGARLPQRGADPLSARHLDHHHHRHHERLFRAADVAAPAASRSTTCPTGGRRGSCSVQTETANGDLVRITLPIVVAVAGRAPDLAADDAHAPPAGSSTPWAAIPRPRAGSASTSAAMHFLAYGYLGLHGRPRRARCRRTASARPCRTPCTATSSTCWRRPSSAAPASPAASAPCGGVLLGILLLAILQNGLNLLGVSPYFFQIVIGLVILISTSITGLSARGRRARRRVAARPPVTERAPRGARRRPRAACPRRRMPGNAGGLAGAAGGAGRLSLAPAARPISRPSARCSR